MEEGRSKRAIVPRGGHKFKSALDKLKELKKSGAKQVDSFELREEEAIYDELDAAGYAKLVQKRREEGGAHCWGSAACRQLIGPPDGAMAPAMAPAAAAAPAPPPVATCRPAAAALCPAGGFVIDKDGLGYVDVGEEDDWGAEQQEEEQAEGEGGGEGKGKKGACLLPLGRRLPLSPLPCPPPASPLSPISQRHAAPSPIRFPAPTTSFPLLPSLPTRAPCASRRGRRQAQGGRGASARRPRAHAAHVPDRPGKGQAQGSRG